MKNPCKECLVTMMCKDPCDEAMERLRDIIKSFIPDRKAIIDQGFLRDMCISVKEDPDKNQPIEVNYSNEQNMPGLLHVKDGYVFKITKGVWG